MANWAVASWRIVTSPLARRQSLLQPCTGFLQLEVIKVAASEVLLPRRCFMRNATSPDGSFLSRLGFPAFLGEAVSSEMSSIVQTTDAGWHHCYQLFTNQSKTGTGGRLSEVTPGSCPIPAGKLAPAWWHLSGDVWQGQPVPPHQWGSQVSVPCSISVAWHLSPSYPWTRAFLYTWLS